MSLFSRVELKTLTKERRNGCVSVYLPTHRAGHGVKQDRIRLKNSLAEAEKQLIANGIRATEARRILEPAQRLLSDALFWRHQSDGLAVFLSPGGSHHYRLPLDFKELVVVTNRFHVKPLLPMLTNNGQFYVLALSQKHVRLFQGTRYSVREIELEGIPTSRAEALKYDQFEKQLQFHTRTAGGKGKRAAMFHGQGIGVDDAKTNLLRYFRQIDKGLRDLLGDERVPLVMAGVDYLLPIYREANTYPHLVDAVVTGNPDRTSADGLHAKAWAIMRPHFQQVQRDAITQYRQLAGTGRTSKDIREIIPAAFHRRVALLFVAVGVQRWGIFDPKNNALDRHNEAQPCDEDLLDYAAIQTLINGGVVYAVKPSRVPDGAPLAAVFRY